MLTQTKGKTISALYPLITDIKKTDPTDARASNIMMILGLLFPTSKLSRAQISRKTGLSRVSTSEVVSTMIDKHLLRESDKEPPQKRGKKGVLLEVDANHWNIVSINLAGPYLVQGAVTNILGHVLARIEQPLEHSTDATAQMVLQMCRELISRAPGVVAGIGVAVPGVVDGQGTVLDSQNLGWSYLDLKPILEKELPYPCFIDNDANSALLTERFFASKKSNIIFVHISEGVGAALLIDDSMVVGLHHAAGEIGHVVVNANGPLCVCGKRGCLESYISTVALRTRIASRKQSKAKVLETAGDYLGRALAFSTSLLDINDVAIYGPPDVVNDTLITSTSRVLNSCTLTEPFEHVVTVRRAGIGEDTVLRGESIQVLHNILLKM